MGYCALIGHTFGPVIVYFVPFLLVKKEQEKGTGV